MFIPACAAFLVLAFILNIRTPRMLALTIIVGCSFFADVPTDTAEQFYGFCIATELLVAFASIKVAQNAGLLVAHICGLLIITHIGGYVLDGYPPFSPYRVMVKLLEFSQILACVALSPAIAPILRNRDATTT